MSITQITPVEQSLMVALHNTTEVLKQVTAERDALRADAERYRWWVNTMTSEDAMDIISDAFQHLPHDTVPSKEQFAEVIDAAMKSKS